MKNSNTEYQSHGAGDDVVLDDLPPGGGIWPDPDMEIVARNLLPPPSLDIAKLLPSSLQRWVKEMAGAKAAPVDYVFGGMLAASASIIGATRRASPWAEWSEPAVLWFALVGSPSSNKSPGLDPASEALSELEREISADYGDRLAEFEAAKVIAKAKHDAYKATVKDSVQAGNEPPAAGPGILPPPEPARPRTVVSDTTIEAVADVLFGNPRGVCLLVDEMAGWLGNLNKYGAGDRQQYLQFFGARSKPIDRKKNGGRPIILQHAAVSVVGTIQPEPFSTLLMTGDDDGLFGRFVPIWPNPVPPTRPTSFPDRDVLLHIFRRLHSLEFQVGKDGALIPVLLKVEPLALATLQEWRMAHHDMAHKTGGLLGGALGKMPGLVLRVALVLELLWWAAGRDGCPPDVISPRSLGAALDFVDGYVVPMVRRILGDATLAQSDRNCIGLAEAIIERQDEIVTGGGIINASFVRRRWGVPGIKEKDDTSEAFAALVQANWLRPAKSRSGSTKGRQRQDYHVNPKLLGGAP